MYARIADICREPEKFLGKRIKVGGWTRTVRDGKALVFVELHDGSYFKTLQVVIEPESLSLTGEDEGEARETARSRLCLNEAQKLGAGACLTVAGVLAESPGAKQPFELKAEEIILEGSCGADYPLQKKRHSLEFLRTITHLRPRANTFSAVFRVRSLASYAIHKFFAERGFVYVHTPILTASDCEGAGEMFQATTLKPGDVPMIDGAPDYSKDFFGKWAGLTVSGQLAVEAYASAFRDVYAFGPTFRAENSNTTTHAAEFWMLEPEIAFADLDDAQALAEEMLKFLIGYALENAKDEMEFLNAHIDDGLLSRLNAALESEFAHISYGEAVELLQKSGEPFEYPAKWGLPLQTAHERYLTEQIFGKPVFVRDYPREIKSFYMRQNDDGKTAAAADLLAPGIGELIGGSQREERLDRLLDNMRQKNIDPADYGWYADLRRFGTVKHAGFGLGFERFVMYLTGIKNIRDVIPFPRTANSMSI